MGKRKTKDSRMKPCPICGKEAVLIEIKFYVKPKWYISCKSPYCVEQKHFYSTKIRAIKSWNRRAKNE